MPLKKTESAPRGVRYDSRHIRLRVGETERKEGGYVYRWTDHIGKRHAVYASTLNGLREREDEVAADRHDGIKSNIKTITVNEMFDRWCQLKRGIKDSTMTNYIYMYELIVKPSFGKKKLWMVKKSDVRRFYNQLVDDKRMKVSTIDGVHNVLHQVFQIAVDDDMIRGNPADHMMRELKQIRGLDEEKRKALTLEQEKLFFDYLQRTPRYNHWYPVFYVMANTGMRVGELTGLRWCDIDLEKGTISINHTLVYYNHRDGNGCYYSINTPKTKAGEREIPIMDGVKKALEMEKEYQELCGITSKSHIEGYRDFVFVNKDGDVFNQAALNKAIKRITRDCNEEIFDHMVPAKKKPVLLPAFSCHVLRHTFATRMCESGLNVKVVQAILGHANVSTTLDIYVSVTNELKKQELSAYEAYIETGVKQQANI